MSPVLGIIASSTQQGRGGGPISAFDALSSIVVPLGGVATVNFNSIPSTYTHLQIRAIGRSAGTNNAWRIRFNGDGGSNYSRHYLLGTGANPPEAIAGTSTTSIGLGVFSTSTQTSGVFTGLVADILDYKNTSKNSTLRSSAGFDSNGSGTVGLFSGAWFNTAAITSMTIFVDAGNIAEYSQFALYGVK